MAKRWWAVSLALVGLAAGAVSGVRPAAGAPPAPAGPTAMCDVLRQLGPAAADGFRAIDLGRNAAITSANVHTPSVSLPGARCFIAQDRPANYMCGFVGSPNPNGKSIELLGALKQCLGVDPQFVDAGPTGEPGAVARARGPNTTSISPRACPC